MRVPDKARAMSLGFNDSKEGAEAARFQLWRIGLGLKANTLVNMTNVGLFIEVKFKDFETAELVGGACTLSFW